jgi:CHAD domain-containing protein
MFRMSEPAASDLVEVEWQYSAADTSTVVRWLESAAVPGYTVAPGKTKELNDTYFDTPDWRVHHGGFTCRIRDKGDAAELTLKSMADAVGSMRSRREMTEPLQAGGAPLAAPGICGQTLRLLAGPRPFQPIFNLRTHRQTFILLDGQGTLAEIAVDNTTIPVGEAVPVRLTRVEVEVDANAVVRARRFVDVLVAAAELNPADTSKFEAALMATGQLVPPSRPDLGSTEITAHMSAADVAYAVMRKHFGTFLANEAGTRLGDDIEALHDMRVATRRLRAAMSAFAPFCPPRLQPFRDQFGWVAALLGEVRDLDVQIERMAEWRAGFNEAQAHALDSLEALLAARRAVARKRMLAGLDSRRCESLIARFATTLRRGPVRSFAPGRTPILAVGPDLVERRYRRLRRNGDKIDRKTLAGTYHLLRIDAKKLRYALEFVGPIYGKPATDFVVRLTALQDLLGLHQDADVAQEVLHGIAETHGRRLGPATLLVMGAIAERYRRHAEELRRDFPRAYKPITGAEWRNLLKTMESRRPPTTAPSTKH